MQQRAKAVVPDLEATREALSRWRRGHGGRGHWIPEELWRDAAAVARERGISETARALRLDATRLAQRAGEVEAPSFMELTGFGLGGARPVAVIELFDRDGARMRVEVDPGVVDVVALARGIWGRGS